MNNLQKNTYTLYCDTREQYESDAKWAVAHGFEPDILKYMKNEWKRKGLEIPTFQRQKKDYSIYTRFFEDYLSDDQVRFNLRMEGHRVSITQVNTIRKALRAQGLIGTRMSRFDLLDTEDCEAIKRCVEESETRSEAEALIAERVPKASLLGAEECIIYARRILGTFHHKPVKRRVTNLHGQTVKR